MMLPASEPSPRDPHDRPRLRSCLPGSALVLTFFPNCLPADHQLSFLFAASRASPALTSCTLRSRWLGSRICSRSSPNGKTYLLSFLLAFFLRQGFVAVDHADAGRCAGRNLGHRQAGRDQRRAPGGERPGASRSQSRQAARCLARQADRVGCEEAERLAHDRGKVGTGFRKRSCARKNELA